LLRRWLFRLLGLGVGILGLYLIAMNVFLRTTLFRRLMSYSPDDVLIDYTSAYSLFPGRIHADGLRIRGSDSMVQWILVIDHCDFRLWPLDLIHRKFHASHVRGDGMSFRLRMKLSDADATPKLVAALPPVPGFSDPPYKLIGPREAPLTDDNYNLVGIQLDDVVADHVREVWVDSLRLTGEMRIAGRWLFRPLRWLDMGPASVTMMGVDLTHGPDRPIATNLHGEVRVTIHPFDIRIPNGYEVLDYLSADPTLQGTLNAASAFETFAHVPEFQFARGEGPFAATMFIDHGKLLVGSHVEGSLDEAELDRGDLKLTSAAGVEVSVVQGTTGPLTRVTLGLANPRFWNDEGGEVARASSVGLTALSPNADLAHPSYDGTTFSADVRGIWAPSLAPLAALSTEHGLDVRSGAVSGDAHLDGRSSDFDATGAFGFRVDALSVVRKKDRIAADVQGRLELDGISLRDRWARVSGSRVSLSNVVAKLDGVDAAAPNLELLAPRALLREGKSDIELQVGLPRVDLQDLRQLNALLPHGSPPALVRIEQGRGAASANLRVNLESLAVVGDAHASTEGLHLRVGSESFASNLSLRVKARSYAADSRVTDLSGTSIAFDTVTKGGGEPWWARIVAPAATVRLAGGAGLFARVAMDAKDATPAEALVAQVTGVPRWLLEADPMGELKAQGEIRAGPSTLEVRSVEARGGSASLSLEYAKHGADAQGAALVHVGILGLGLKLAGTGPSLVLVGAQSWFERKVKTMREYPPYSSRDE
jgi:hypothetical protein